ncbi:MAG: hypothetical protein ABIK28_01755 [Planctomycetota bacterium]
MQIRIVFTGTPFIDGLSSGDSIELEEGLSIKELLLRFHVEERFHLFIVPMIHGEYRDPETLLHDQDELTLFLPVSGG